MVKNFILRGLGSQGGSEAGKRPVTGMSTAKAGEEGKGGDVFIGGVAVLFRHWSKSFQIQPFFRGQKWKLPRGLAQDHRVVKYRTGIKIHLCLGPKAQWLGQLAQR